MVISQPIKSVQLNVPVTLDNLGTSIRSVNFHLTKACNYRCKFCYAHFNQVDDHLSYNECMELIKQLSNAGTEKITFVGGEPTLVRFLPQLIRYAKNLGITTMIVTNGSRLTENYIRELQGYLDWVGLSIDSSIEVVNRELGRGNGDHVMKTLNNARLLKKYGIRLKVNTVINKMNYSEDMNEMLRILNPERWKVFQILPIEGENDQASDLLIDKNKFNHFISRHVQSNPTAENNDDMTDSYIMIDPKGCFFNNSTGSLSHGRSILEVGVREAFNDTNFKQIKFDNREGEYNW